MKFILDTHTFIWWDSEPTRLSQHTITLSITIFISDRYNSQSTSQLDSFRFHPYHKVRNIHKSKESYVYYYNY